MWTSDRSLIVEREADRSGNRIENAARAFGAGLGLACLGAGAALLPLRQDIANSRDRLLASSSKLTSRITASIRNRSAVGLLLLLSHKLTALRVTPNVLPSWAWISL